MSITLDSTKGIYNAQWTSGTRPIVGLVPGQQGFNTTLGVLEIWDGLNWTVSASGVNPVDNNTFTGINTFANGVVIDGTLTLSNTLSSNSVISTTANISGAYILGNGSQLTGLPAGYGNANLANIGSNVIVTTGNITAGNFIGNGQYLTNINGSNVTGTVANATFATSAGTATSATTAATVTTNAQPNITSVGTLSSLSVTGNTSSGNFIGNGQYLSNINASNIVGAYGNANVADYLPTYTGNVGGANAVITGTIYANTFSAPSGTFTVLSNLDVKGNVTYIESNVVTINDVNITLANNAANATQADGGGFTINGANASFTFSAASNTFVSTQGIDTNSNISAAYFVGNGSTLTNINGSNVTGTVANATFATSAGTATSATTSSTVTGNAQANITSVGTLTSLSVTGNTTSGNFIGNGQYLSNIVGANVTGTVANATTAANVTVSGITGLGANVATFLATPTSANLASTVTDETGSGNLVFNTSPTLSTITVNSSSSAFAAILQNAVETANVIASAPSSTQTVYFNTGAVVLFTSNATTNWTVNLTYSSGTTLNSAMAIGQAATIAVLTTQGATAYYNSAVQVDGNAVTPYWQGGSAPTSGNTTGIDAYTYTIIKTANATFTVMASLTQF